MRLEPCKISGCYQLFPDVVRDNRGSFVKIFHQPLFSDLGLTHHFPEVYYSISSKNVIRGMHFQLPPDEHVKVVHCTLGNVIDVLVDLRVGSPTFGQHQLIELASDNSEGVYIAKGVAHGFCVLSQEATLIYQVSTVYNPQADSGLRWDSLGIDWPVQSPIISSRDAGLISFSEFNSSFIYSENSK